MGHHHHHIYMDLIITIQRESVWVCDGGAPIICLQIYLFFPSSYLWREKTEDEFFTLRKVDWWRLGGRERADGKKSHFFPPSTLLIRHIIIFGYFDWEILILSRDKYLFNFHLMTLPWHVAGGGEQPSRFGMCGSSSSESSSRNQVTVNEQIH